MPTTREPSAALLSAAQLLKSWRYPEDLPAGLPPLKPILMEAEGFQAPCGPKTAGVVLDKVFSVLSRPNDDAIPIWIKIASEYPDWALMAGAESLIRGHKFGRPPLPAELSAAVDADPVYIRRRTMLARLRSAEMKQRHDAEVPQLTGPARDVRPLLADLGSALAKPVREHTMSPAEFARRKAEVLAECERAGMGGA